MSNRFGRVRIATTLLTLASMTGCSKTPSKADPSIVHITWNVATPVPTPATADVHLSGNLDAVGKWNGSGVILNRVNDQLFTTTLDLPRDAKSLEYKFTLGSWDTVEQSSDHADVPNRTLVLDRDQSVDVTVAAWRDASLAATRPSTLTGDVRFHRAFHSNVFGSDRTIAVWLPPGYEAATGKRYPVLYMQDGQNLFDDATSFSGEWHADETAAHLIAAGKIEPIIIVAIDNAGENRTFEYTPTARLSDAEAKKPLAEQKREGGGSDQFSKFLIDEVKRMIDRTYRTLPDREHTAIAGSSLGGLNSLYLCWKHGDVFSRCGAISPSLWWDHRAMLIQFEVDHAWMKRTKIWVDIGTEEGDEKDHDSAVVNVRELRAIMQRTKLIDGIDYKCLVVAGAKHDETAWSARFDQVLTFLFPKLPAK